MTSGLKLNVFMPNRQYISNIYSTIVVYNFDLNDIVIIILL